MNFKDIMAADAAAIVDPVGGFAEWIIYNGARVPGIFEQGEEKQKGNGFAPEGLSDRGILHVLVSAIPNPQSEDSFTRKDAPGKTWRVARVLETAGGMHRLECTANEFAFGR